MLKTLCPFSDKIDNRNLMVGDYVLYEGKPTHITQINDEGDLWTEANPFTENEGIKPIKISVEFLNTNFDAYDDDDVSLYLFPDDPSLTIKYYNDGDVRGFCVGHLTKNGFSPFIFIDYVHELQHIIRLFGVARFGNFGNEFVIY